jgi:large subunit ribosomal protein L3
MGHDTVTIQNLTIVRADVENNILLVKGNVPGANKSLLIVRNAFKKQNR